MKNKTLIISATHGNETFSIPVVKKLQQKFQFDWVIGNPRAFKQGTRFFQSDLNRSAPGKTTSKNYELRRARQLVNLGSKYNQTIDLHGTSANSGLFIILSDPNWQNIEFAKRLNVKNVVLWPSLKPKGPLTQFIPNSLEIECGPKNDPDMAKKLTATLSRFLSGKPRSVKQYFYIVTSSLLRPVKQTMTDFVPTTYRNKSFIPLLVDQYPNLKCYCLQRISKPLDFNTINKTG